MIEKLYQANGNKISSLLVSGNSFKFSSASFQNIESFKTSYDKKLSLSTKLEIPFDKVKYITKEEKSDTIVIHYKSKTTIPMACEFTLNNTGEFEQFTQQLENDLGLKQIKEVKSPFKAGFPNLFIGLFIAAFTWLGYYRLEEINNGTALAATSGKSRLFDQIVTLLGTNALLVIGGGLTVFFIVKAAMRFSNPPNETKWIFRNR